MKYLRKYPLSTSLILRPNMMDYYKLVHYVCIHMYQTTMIGILRTDIHILSLTYTCGSFKDIWGC
jgi:hypothetical protein